MGGPRFKGDRPAGEGRSDGRGKGKGKGKSKAKGYPSDKPGYVWVAKTFRRLSMFSTRSFEDVANIAKFPGNCRMSQLRTDSEMLGILECIVIEPPGKALVPEAFATSGVIICLHGMPPSDAVLEEWTTAAHLVGWSELSCTVVIPNLQMSAALQLADFEAIVDAALELADFNRCLIVGKAWGAHRAVEIASMASISGKVEGVILVAPSSPAPDVCRELAVPVMMVWAFDDEVSSFSESEAWMEALDDRCAPSTFLKCSEGGHRLDRMLNGKLEVQAVRNFTAAAFLVGELEDAASEDEGEMSMGKAMSVRETRLNSELPRFLQEEDDPSDEDDSHDGEESTPSPKRSASLVLEPADQARRKSIKAMDIMQWMQAGMTTAAE